MAAFWAAVDVDPGASSGDTSDGPTGARRCGRSPSSWAARATRCGGICVTRRRVATDRARRAPCKLDPYKDYLRERVEQARPRWIPATVLLREIGERGYDGGISQLKAWLAPLKQTEPEPVVRFETAPGEQMQADFTTCAAAAIRCSRSWRRWATAGRRFVQVHAAARTPPRCAPACAKPSTTSAACPSMCCSTTPRRSSSSAMPTATGCTAGTAS